MRKENLDERAIERMQDQKSYSLGGYTFEQWYKAHTVNCYCWVGDYDKEQLRAEYEKLPTQPEIGGGATIILYSDYRGVDIVSIDKNKKGEAIRVGVKHRNYQHKAYGEGNCEILEGYWSDDVEYFTKRRGGGWYAEGEPKSRHSTKLAMGYQRTYIDPSF